MEPVKNSSPLPLCIIEAACNNIFISCLFMHQPLTFSFLFALSRPTQSRLLDDLRADGVSLKPAAAEPRVAPKGRRSAQHAAVATAPCFHTEVKNADASPLISADGDGIGRRDGKWEGEKGQDSGLIHHLFTQALPPRRRFTQRALYMIVFMNCSPPL